MTPSYSPAHSHLCICGTPCKKSGLSEADLPARPAQAGRCRCGAPCELFAHVNPLSEHEADLQAWDQAVADASNSQGDNECVISTGTWAGLTEAEVRAWAWNLAVSEPWLLTTSKVDAARWALEHQQAGGAPAGFFEPIAERMRELKMRGVTPQDYRHRIDHQQRLLILRQCRPILRLMGLPDTPGV